MNMNQKILKSHVIVLCIYTVIFCGFFSRLFLPKPSVFITPEFGRSDISDFNFPVKTILSENLKKNQLPLWNKNMATGYPIYAESQIGTWYLPNLLLFKFLPPWLAFNINFITTFIIAAFGMYFYLLYLKRSISVAFYGGLIFAFSGFFMGHISHLNMIQAASLFPWTVIFVKKYLSKPTIKLLTIGTIVLSQQLFAGHLQITFLTGLYIFLGTFAELIDGNYKKWIRENILLVFIFFTAFFLSAVQMLPSLELHSLSVRSGTFTYALVVFFSLFPQHLLTIFHPFILGQPINASYIFHFMGSGNIFWENNLSVGFATGILVLLSAKFLGDRKVRLLWFMGIIWMLAMFGKYSPLYFIYTIPPFSLFTTPARFSFLFIVVLILLGTFSYDAYFSKRKLFIHILGIFTIVELFAAWYFYHPTQTVQGFLTPPESVAYVKASGEKDRVAGINLGEYGYIYYSHNGWKNINNIYYYKNELIPNTNVFWNIPHYDVYVGRIWVKRKSFYDNLVDINTNDDKLRIASTSARLISIANVGTIISAGKATHATFKETAEINPYQGTDIEKRFKYYIYHNTQVLPRARIVPMYQTVKTLDDIIYVISDPTFNPEKLVVLEENPKINKPLYEGTSLQSSVIWKTDEDMNIELATKSSHDAFLILADTFYPGWKAYVDGRETKIYPAYVAFRAIVLPQGEHSVTFRYEPGSLRKGIIVSTTTFILLILAMIFSSFPRLRQFFSSTRKLFSHH